MYKDFEGWNEEKIKVDNAERQIFFHEREVWWCRLGVNVGYEQDGKGTNFARPIVVFKKFNNELCWAIALTSKMKKGKFYIPLDLRDGIVRVAVISQLRLVDAKRMYQKIGTASVVDMNILRKAVIGLCEEKR